MAERHVPEQLQARRGRAFGSGPPTVAALEWLIILSLLSLSLTIAITLCVCVCRAQLKDSCYAYLLLVFLSFPTQHSSCLFFNLTHSLPLNLL